MDFDEMDIEPKAKNTEASKINLSLKDETTDEQQLREELLLKTVQLDDGCIGYVFTSTQMGAIETWRCHACGFVDSWKNLTKHAKSVWHNDVVSRQPLARSCFTKVDNAISEISSGQPLPPGMEDEITGPCFIEKSIETFPLPLIGVEYLAEVHVASSKEPRYICLLCDKRGDPRSIMVHLTSTTHYVVYLRRFFPTFYSLVSKLPKSVECRTAVNTVLSHLIAKIEEKYGHLKPICVKEDIITFPELKKNVVMKADHGIHFTELPEDLYLQEMLSVEYVQNIDLLHKKFPLKPKPKKEVPKCEPEEKRKKDFSKRQIRGRDQKDGDKSPDKPSDGTSKSDSRDYVSRSRHSRSRSPRRRPYSPRRRSRSRPPYGHSSPPRSYRRRSRSPRRLSPFLRFRSRSRSPRHWSRPYSPRRRSRSYSPRSRYPWSDRQRSPRSIERRPTRRDSPKRSSRDAKRSSDVRRNHSSSPVVSKRSREHTGAPSAAPENSNIIVLTNDDDDEIPNSDNDMSYEKQVKFLETKMAEELEKVKKSPEKHPAYSMEWKVFWARRSKEVESMGKDPKTYDYTPDWIKYWNKKIEEIFNNELQKQKIKLKLQLVSNNIKEKTSASEKPETTFKEEKSAPAEEKSSDAVVDIKKMWKEFTGFEIRDRVESPSWEQSASEQKQERSMSPISLKSLSSTRSKSRSRSRSPSLSRQKSRHERSHERSHGRSRERSHRRSRGRSRDRSRDRGSRSRNDSIERRIRERRRENPNKVNIDNPLNVITVLRQLSILEVQLGSYAAHIINLLSSGLAMERVKPNSSIDLLTPENMIFMDMVKEKLKGQLLAGLVPKQLVKTTLFCIKSIDELLTVISEIKPLTTPPIPQPNPKLLYGDPVTPQMRMPYRGIPSGMLDPRHLPMVPVLDQLAMTAHSRYMGNDLSRDYSDRHRELEFRERELDFKERERDFEYREREREPDFRKFRDRETRYRDRELDYKDRARYKDGDRFRGTNDRKSPVTDTRQMSESKSKEQPEQQKQQEESPDAKPPVDPAKNDETLCWYHRKHGATANRCVSPCSFTERQTVTKQNEKLEIDRAVITQQVRSELIANGTEFTEETLALIVDSVVADLEAKQALVAEKAKNDESKTVDAPKSNETVTLPEGFDINELPSSTFQLIQDVVSKTVLFENLSDEEMITKLRNFKNIPREEQERLIGYLRKLEATDPARVEELKKYVNLR